jgi:hypothetical protein
MDSAQDTRTGQVLACEEPFFSDLLAADHQTANRSSRTLTPMPGERPDADQE